MKKIVAGLLLTGAFAFAAERRTTVQMTPEQQHHLAWYTKDALRTQSPRVHLAKKRNGEYINSRDVILRNKTTYAVFIPAGK